MEHTALSLAVELKRQIDSKMPSRPLKGGGMHELTIKASASDDVSSEVYFEAVGLLLEQLADEYPEWEIGLGGDPSDLEITFSR